MASKHHVYINNLQYRHMHRHTYVYPPTHTHMYTHICAPTHPPIHTCTHTYVHPPTHTRMYTDTDTVTYWHRHTDTYTPWPSLWTVTLPKLNNPGQARRLKSWSLKAFYSVHNIHKCLHLLSAWIDSLTPVLTLIFLCLTPAIPV